ncbi:MAG: acyl-CoA dehydrogenase family protein [Candidatus Geothermarchaeales archaeon]
MAFSLTSEQQMIKAMVKEFAEKEIKPIAAQIDRDREFPRETIKKMAPLGLLGMSTPQKYGGAGADFVSFVVAVEEVSRCCSSTAALMVVHNAFVCSVIDRYGTDEQKRAFLTPLARGERLGAYGLTESASGSEIGAVQTRARLSGEGYAVDGSKRFVIGGGEADTYIVFAKTGERDGISAFIAERGLEGLSFGRPERMLGVRATSTAPLYLNDCLIPKENLLGDVGEGIEIARVGLDNLRLGIAAQAVGIAQAALERCVEYANERVQFGQPIGRFQAVQRMIVDMATETEAARSLVYRCAALRDRGEDFRKEASMAKLFASSAAVRATKNAIRVHGGYGYMRDYPLERLARDARVTAIYGDPSEIQRNVIAKVLLGYED